MDIILIDNDTDEARFEEHVLKAYLLNPVRTFADSRAALEHIFVQGGMSVRLPQMVFAEAGSDPWSVLELVLALRRDPRTAHIPVILLTDSEARLQRLPFPSERCAVLLKPLDLSRLSEALRATGVRWVLTDTVPAPAAQHDYAGAGSAAVPLYV